MNHTYYFLGSEYFITLLHFPQSILISLLWPRSCIPSGAFPISTSGLLLIETGLWASSLQPPAFSFRPAPLRPRHWRNSPAMRRSRPCAAALRAPRQSRGLPDRTEGKGGRRWLSRPLQDGNTMPPPKALVWVKKQAHIAGQAPGGFAKPNLIACSAALKIWNASKNLECCQKYFFGGEWEQI